MLWRNFCCRYFCSFFLLFLLWLILFVILHIFTLLYQKQAIRQIKQREGEGELRNVGCYNLCSSGLSNERRYDGRGM